MIKRIVWAFCSFLFSYIYLYHFLLSTQFCNTFRMQAFSFRIYCKVLFSLLINSLCFNVSIISLSIHFLSPCTYISRNMVSELFVFVWRALLCTHFFLFPIFSFLALFAPFLLQHVWAKFCRPRSTPNHARTVHAQLSLSSSERKSSNDLSLSCSWSYKLSLME